MVILLSIYKERGAIKDIGEHTSVLGTKALLMGGRTALSVSQRAIEEGFRTQKMGCVAERFGGESTRSEINRLVSTDIIAKAPVRFLGDGSNFSEV